MRKKATERQRAIYKWKIIPNPWYKHFRRFMSSVFDKTKGINNENN